ncbi:MAG: hypothetical protein WC408_06985 [Candidatus Micrarchaeia archaeon]|jgi:hypothetical protein
MNAMSIVAFGALLFAFFGVLAYNSLSGMEKVTYEPPYYFVKGDSIAYVNAFCFVFLFSMLFFGMGAPAAMAIEGAKYAILFSILPLYDLLFVIPELLAMLAASKLGEGVMADWSGEGNIYGYWNEGVRLLLMGIAALVILIVAKPFVLPLIGMA